jgi:signal transduction histidine kinase
VARESADQIKSAFLATMSHELRTPLNSILGFTGIILQQLAGPLTPEQSKQLGMVQSSARHLLELINDVLDISKIEADQLEVRFAPFDLRASIERVTASVKPLAERKRLDLNLILPPVLEIESDRRRVEQILLNLLNNALKFTDRGAVTLLAEVAACGSSATGEPRSSIRIEVTDTGIGMKHDDLAKLFQPFQQIDSGLGRQHEGTGLGLAICSRLTRLLGGTIAATSTTGNGSVFTVVLPSLPLDVTS